MAFLISLEKVLSLEINNLQTAWSPDSNVVLFWDLRGLRGRTHGQKCQAKVRLK